MNGRQAASERLLAFYSLVFALSIPFWLINAVADRLRRRPEPVDLPLSALAFVNPLLAALLLTRREGGPEAAKALLRESLAFDRIRPRRWQTSKVRCSPIAALARAAPIST